MCDRIEAVREMRRSAQRLTAACTVASICRVFDPVADQPLPSDVVELLKRLAEAPPPLIT